jgi:hypothetical protein
MPGGIAHRTKRHWLAVLEKQCEIEWQIPQWLVDFFQGTPNTLKSLVDWKPLTLACKKTEKVLGDTTLFFALC